MKDVSEYAIEPKAVDNHKEIQLQKYKQIKSAYRGNMVEKIKPIKAESKYA